MNNSDRLSVLADMGITWYVSSDFDVSPFSVVPSLQAIGAIVPNSEAPTQLDRPITVASLLESVAVVEPVLELNTAGPEADIPSSVAETITVEPFHWLIAQADFVYFVCAIKQARLAPVWHSAAQELLGDIAIAMGAKAQLSSEYFSWPPASKSDALTDADLPDFLAEYLSGSDKNDLYILMGESAQQHVNALVLKGKQQVLSVPLGQLFRDPEQKKELWQQLKPLRR